MITCPKCGKENQDHYKFCLGCGSELPRDVAAPARGTFSTPTPPAGIPVAQPGGGPGAMPAFAPAPPPAFPHPVPPPAIEPPPVEPPSAEPLSIDGPAIEDDIGSEEEPTLAPMGAMVPCPNCGAQNPSNFKFCGACGARIEAQPAAAEPGIPPATILADAAAHLVLIRPDGSEGGVFPLMDGETTVGRATGQLFAADAYLSPEHATFIHTPGRMIIRDESSLNGVYVRIPAEKSMEIAAGDIVRMGQELVRVEGLPTTEPDNEGTELMGSVADEVWGRVALIVGDGQVANAFCLSGEGVVLGRERGDVLFPEDGYVSGTHVRIQRHGEGMLITDLNSSNGTFLRVNKEQEINKGDYILMGQQLFRVDF